jgi:hypothetical protein
MGYGKERMERVKTMRKKTKRTKTQMKKLRRKQREMMMRTTEKSQKKIERIKNTRKKRENRFIQFINNPKPLNPNEDYLYHITTINRLEKIVSYGGLIGNRGNTINDMSKKGYLYMVNSDNKRVWNGVSYMELFEKEIDLFGRNGEPYEVIGIPISYFNNNELVLEQDPSGETIDIYHIKVNLMSKLIPLSEVHYIGHFITDGKDYDYDFLWELCEIKSGRKKEDIKLDCGKHFGGVRTYENRVETSLVNLYPTIKSKKEYIRERKRMEN